MAINRSKWNDNSHHSYSHKLDQELKVTNQKSSGRCWLFAALNALRIPFAARLSLDSFEFSQTYLFFYDKFERANYFLVGTHTTGHSGSLSSLIGLKYALFSGIDSEYRKRGD